MVSSIHPKNKLKIFNFCPSLLGQKFVRFLEELKKTKSPFEINWPLKTIADKVSQSKIKRSKSCSSLKSIPKHCNLIYIGPSIQWFWAVLGQLSNLNWDSSLNVEQFLGYCILDSTSVTLPISFLRRSRLYLLIFLL